MTDQTYKEIEIPDISNIKYSKLYINNSSRKLILGWSNEASILWLLIFGPFYYFKKGVILWGALSLLPYWIVITETHRATNNQNLNSYILFFILYLTLLPGAKSRILKIGTKISENKNALYDGSNLIIGTTSQNQKILSVGLSKYLEGQKNQENIELQKSKKEEFLLKKERFIKSIKKAYEKTISQKTSKFSFNDGIGFGIYPENVKFTWAVHNPEALKVIEQAKHIQSESDITKLESRISQASSANNKDVLPNLEKIILFIDQEEIKFDQILKIIYKENQKITQAREEKTKFITTGISASNITKIGSIPIGVSRSKTIAETEVKEEKGNLIIDIEVNLKDGRKFSASNKFRYEGDTTEKAYFEFLKLIDFIKNNSNRNQPNALR